MASIHPKSLNISNPFPYTLKSPPKLSYRPNTPPPPPPRAAAGDDEPPPATPAADPSFDTRLAQVRLKYRSGTGKKAEQRRARKAAATGGGGAKKKGGSGVMLPPVALREAVSPAARMAVELGFTPYSEWLNGRMAGLGLAALLLVELGSGKGLFAYHPPPVVFFQIYTVAAAATVFIKYEKERNSVWPKATPPPPEASAVAGD